MSFITVEYFMQFLSITIVFAVCSQFLFASKWVLAVLLIEYISLQLASEALHLYMFKKNTIPLEKNKVYNIFLLVFSLACAYEPLVSSRVLIYSIIKNPFFVTGAGILGILSVYYIYFGFNGYNSELASVFKREDLKEELAKKAQESILYNDISIEMSIPEKAKGLHGFDLLNCIFFIRHKKSLHKYFKRRMIVFALVTISAILWSFNDFSSAHILGNIYKFIPVIPIMLSQLSYGEGFCKFSYNHCDSQLMSYSFYKTKTAVFSNYLIRLKEVLKYNMLLGITMLGCFLLILSFAGINIGSLKMILFILTLFCLLLMFGVHHVSIYYLIQPYVKDSTIQNPILFMMQLPLFFLNYMMLMLNVSPVLIMGLLLSLCIVYPVVLIVLVRCKGERTFILK